VPELPWVDFIRLHPGAHLVTASVVPPRTGQHLARPRRLLNQLIREQAPTGDFATTVVRTTEGTKIHCGLASRADADGFAGLAGARRRTAPSAGASGWASCRMFRLDAAREVALAGRLAAPGDEPPPA
jgi:hypothetical protein